MSVAPKIEPLTTEGPQVMSATWWLTADAPEGKPLLVAKWSDRTVQAEGIFGGASVLGMVSNSGEEYVPGLSIAYPDVLAAPVGAYFAPRLNKYTPESRVRVTLVGRRA